MLKMMLKRYHKPNKTAIVPFEEEPSLSEERGTGTDARPASSAIIRRGASGALLGGVRRAGVGRRDVKGLGRNDEMDRGLQREEREAMGKGEMKANDMMAMSEGCECGRRREREDGGIYGNTSRCGLVEIKDKLAADKQRELFQLETGHVGNTWRGLIGQLFGRNYEEIFSTNGMYRKKSLICATNLILQFIFNCFVLSSCFHMSHFPYYLLSSSAGTVNVLCSHVSR